MAKINAVLTELPDEGVLKSAMLARELGVSRDGTLRPAIEPE